MRPSLSPLSDPRFATYSQTRRNRTAASSPDPPGLGALGVADYPTPHTRAQNSPPIDPPATSLSRASGGVHNPIKQKRKPSQAGESSREPKTKRPVRSDSATPMPAPSGGNEEPEENWDPNRCRKCGLLDGEGRNQLGDMICCQREDAHSDEHWYHFRCAELYASPPEEGKIRILP